MTDQFVAEIRIFGFNFAPKGWAFCDGQLLPISQNTALFSLLGTFYGGDGKSTFALPNLQGSAPLHQGQGNGLTDRFVGEQGGQVNVTLIANEIPVHTHVPSATTSLGTQNVPGADSVWAEATVERQTAKLYKAAPGNVPMSPSAIGVTGSSFPHNNMPPYLVLNFCIAQQGIFPPRS